MPTIKYALADAVKQLQSTTDSALLDAEILLCKLIAKDRAYLRAWPDRELNPEEISEFDNLIQQRKAGQPIAYLTGIREFWSREFIVTPDVLIPRPETELLIELALTLMPTDKSFKMIDLGTGSGIIAITLAKERPNAEVIATDISAAALKVAQQNAEKHQAKNIQFIQSHWFNDLAPEKYDLILSNPPYVAEGDPHLTQGDLRFEPPAALVAAGHGLSDIQNIAQCAPEWLEDSGFLLLEHGYCQQEEVQTLFKSLGYNQIKTEKDLAGQPRATYGQHLPKGLTKHRS